MWRGEVFRATNLGVRESAGRRVVWRGDFNWVEELCGEGRFTGQLIEEWGSQQVEELCGEGMLTGSKSRMARGGLQGN